ncbi:nucleotidyltransferase domain-containing protein [Actinoallomurus acaciae]|uniref:Nucleotidyltransferase domain-containing protein n=1 Tax=Actinoallomurus acaciae TaxID=502577 RepID=A0ABV5YRF0_9ACTN
MDTLRTDRQLRLIAEVLTTSAECGVPLWLRGGWAMDLFLGEVTRDHRDIDWFAWADDAERLSAELTRRGYRRVAGLPPEQQIDMVKDGEDLSFNLLRRDESDRVVVGGGPWAGAPWPQDLLEPHTGRIGSLSAPIIAPRAQIEIKQMMPIWVPGSPRRPKDTEDIARIRAALASARPPRPGT